MLSESQTHMHCLSLRYHSLHLESPRLLAKPTKLHCMSHLRKTCGADLLVLRLLIREPFPRSVHVLWSAYVHITSSDLLSHVALTAKTLQAYVRPCPP